MIESVPSGMERREGCRGRLFSVYVNFTLVGSGGYGVYISPWSPSLLWDIFSG